MDKIKLQMLLVHKLSAAEKDKQSTKEISGLSILDSCLRYFVMTTWEENMIAKKIDKIDKTTVKQSHTKLINNDYVLDLHGYLFKWVVRTSAVTRVEQGLFC